MSETTAIIKAISEYGILIVIASMFIITYWLDRQDRKTIEAKNYEKEKQQTLENQKRDEEYRNTITLLANATNNVAKALDLLREAETNTTNLFLQHDKRSIQTKEDVQRGFNEIKNDLIEFKTIVANCRNK